MNLSNRNLELKLILDVESIPENELQTTFDFMAKTEFVPEYEEYPGEVLLKISERIKGIPKQK